MQRTSIFRHSHFLALDWYGDTTAVLVGGSEKSMPAFPHLILEDCTLVRPDNALAVSFASHCAWVKMVGCRHMVMNFTQLELGGDKISTGIICTANHSPTGRLHVDFEDCVLAGGVVRSPRAAATWSRREALTIKEGRLARGLERNV